MDIKIINDKGVEEKPQPEAPHGEVVGDIGHELEIKAIGQAMGLERDSELGINQSKLQTLLEYAKSQTDDHSLENLKWVIHSLELKLGTPPFSERRINYVTRYAFLLLREKDIKDEKAKFERQI